MCNCPYYRRNYNDKIECKRGHELGKIEGVGIGLHIRNYCDGKYTACRCYKYLNKKW
jgi:hypothetical protein